MQKQVIIALNRVAKTKLKKNDEYFKIEGVKTDNGFIFTNGYSYYEFKTTDIPEELIINNSKKNTDMVLHSVDCAMRSAENSCYEVNLPTIKEIKSWIEETKKKNNGYFNYLLNPYVIKIEAPEGLASQRLTWQDKTYIDGNIRYVGFNASYLKESKIL